MFHITWAYESWLAGPTLISNWIDRCFGQHSSNNSVHSLSRDNPRIPTNPLSGSQQPPLLWRQWIRTKPCSKLRLCVIQTYFSAPSYMKEFFAERYNLVPLIRQLSVTPYTHACLKRIYMGFFVRIYMCICKKMVIYLGIKTPQSRKERKYTWQKNACISCSRNDCKYTWEKTACISCPNLETNRRP